MTSTLPSRQAEAGGPPDLELHQEITELARHVLTFDLGADLEAEHAGWEAVCAAGLISLALPEAVGGDGMGLPGAAAVLVQAGRVASGLPVFSSLALGALPLASCGTTDQQARFLAPLVTGNAILTGALSEPSSSMPRLPRTVARGTADGWVVDGELRAVPAADQALR